MEIALASIASVIRSISVCRERLFMPFFPLLNIVYYGGTWIETVSFGNWSLGVQVALCTGARIETKAWKNCIKTSPRVAGVRIVVVYFKEWKN